MAVELGQCGEKQSSRSAGSDGLCSHPASALVHGMPGLCTDWAGTSKGLRGAGSQFTLLGQQPKSLGRNVPGGVVMVVGCYGKKESGCFFMTVANG